MPRECFIISGGNLLLFGLCMNRISCVSITCSTLLKQTIFVGSFHVLKRMCYRGNKLTIYMMTGPHSAVGNVSGYRCVSDCRSRGREFDPGPVPYFRGD